MPNNSSAVKDAARPRVEQNSGEKHHGHRQLCQHWSPLNEVGVVVAQASSSTNLRKLLIH